MKRSTIVKTFTIAAVTSLALGIVSTAKAADKGCSNTSLTGTFAYTVSGTAVAAPLPVGELYAEVGAQTFDGVGGTTTAGMSNTNGNAMPAATTGTYTVNSDCTGTFTLQIAPGIASHYFFVISDNGAEYRAVCLDPVAVITRSGRRLYPGRNI